MTNILKEKSFKFAIKIVKLSKYLQKEKKEFIMNNQILRSGTAPGALVREAEYAESKPDFIHKLSIALKESNETEFWLDLLFATDYINEKNYNILVKDNKELLKLLISSIKTTKKNLKEKQQMRKNKQ